MTQRKATLSGSPPRTDGRPSATSRTSYVPLAPRYVHHATPPLNHTAVLSTPVSIALQKPVFPTGIPFGNYIVMLLASVVFMIQFTYDSNQQHLTGLILSDWSFPAMLGYMWLHMGPVHIVSNLILLWAFGRYVTTRIGSANYILAYVAVGLASAAVHIIYDGRPAIGASGAIMGVLGLHVVLCFRRFGLLGPWIVLIWFLLDLTVGVISPTAATHMAHVGGFLAGILIAALLVRLNVIGPESQPVTAAP